MPKFSELIKTIEAPEGVKIITILDSSIGNEGGYSVYEIIFSSEYKYIFVKTDTNGIVVAYSAEILEKASSDITSKDAKIDKTAPGVYLLDKSNTMVASAGDVSNCIYIAVPHFGFAANIRVMATNSPICPLMP